MAYFSEYAAIYSRFRTLRVSWYFEVANQENTPISILSGATITSISSSGLGMNYAEGPYFKTRLLGGVNGQNRAIMRGSIALDKLFGTTQVLVDDTFTGSTTSSTLPTASTGFFYIGAAIPGGQVNGFYVQGWIQLQCQLFRRNSLFS